jgi:hypothetical protein
MDDWVRIQFNLGDATKVFLQDGCFDFELVCVTRVLIMAASTFAEVRTLGRDTPRRSFKDVVNARAGEATLLFHERCFDSLAFEHERQKDSLASALFIGWQARQPISAIHEFFDGELQGNLTNHM